CLRKKSRNCFSISCSFHVSLLGYHQQEKRRLTDMKRKAIPALCAAGLLALALTGCGGGTAGGQAEYIGIDAAKAVALEAAGVAEDDAVFSTAGLDKRNGMDYYAVDFTAGGRSYEY